MSDQVPVCANCGEAGRKFDEMRVEMRDGTKTNVKLCDNCYPDFWDDCGPGEFTWLDHLDIEVCEPYWRCEECDNVYDHALVQIVMDTDYDPEREAYICSFCCRKQKERYRPVQKGRVQ